jgi:hypothetical protein
MSVHNKITDLWADFRTAINAAYAEADKTNNQDGQCLRDYAEDISWSDDLAKMLGRETANERQHRSNRPSPKGFSVGDAAKLILMNCAASGATMAAMPRATTFLTHRDTAAEATLIGFLARKHLPATWQEGIKALDYAKLMEVV